RSKLHAAGEIPHHAAMGERGGNSARSFACVADHLVRAAAAIEERAHLVARIGRSKIASALAIPRSCRNLSLRAQAPMGNEQRSPKRSASITGRRLNPKSLEDLLAKQQSIRDAVERHAAG